MVPARGVRRGRAAGAGGRPSPAVRSGREGGNGSVDRVSRRGAVLRARRQLQGARRLRDLPGADGAAGEQSRRGADAGEVLMRGKAVRRYGGGVKMGPLALYPPPPPPPSPPAFLGLFAPPPPPPPARLPHFPVPHLPRPRRQA